MVIPHIFVSFQGFLVHMGLCYHVNVAPKSFFFRGCEELRLWCLWRGIKEEIHLLAEVFSRSPWHFCVMIMISNVKKEITNISYLQPHYVCINYLSARYFDAYRILKITLIKIKIQMWFVAFNVEKKCFIFIYEGFELNSLQYSMLNYNFNYKNKL